MRSANYVEETTTSIAGTSGNGAITLSAITNTPRFSTVFGTQATTIRYVIEDTVNKKFETGVGSVASNVLTRTRPQVTWDGTTYDDSTPAALQFGASPASGNIKIRMSATVEGAGLVLGGCNSTLSGMADWQRFARNNSYLFNGGSARTLVADREYYQAYASPFAGLLDGVQISVATAIAASNIKMALYSVAANGLPGGKIVDFNIIATGSTGVKTDTAAGTWSPSGPVWLAAGWYYVGYIPSAAIAITGTSGAGVPISSPLGAVNVYGPTDTCFVAGSYATGLPASPAPTTLAGITSADARHWLGLRITP